MPTRDWKFSGFLHITDSTHTTLKHFWFIYVNKMYVEISMQMIWKSICHLIWIWITKNYTYPKFWYTWLYIQNVLRNFDAGNLEENLSIDLNITKVYWARCRKENRYLISLTFNSRNFAREKSLQKLGQWAMVKYQYLIVPIWNSPIYFLPFHTNVIYI